jgi:hypothetical protein
MHDPVPLLQQKPGSKKSSVALRLLVALLPGTGIANAPSKSAFGTPGAHWSFGNGPTHCNSALATQAASQATSQQKASTLQMSAQQKGSEQPGVLCEM